MASRQLKREEQKDTPKSLQNLPSGSLTPNTPTNPEPRASMEETKREGFRIKSNSCEVVVVGGNKEQQKRYKKNLEDKICNQTK